MTQGSFGLLLARASLPRNLPAAISGSGECVERRGVVAEREAEEKRRRGEGEGMFNLLIQFLPMLVTLPLREGGQMEHAAQNTQTKSHFLSTSQPPLFASPCLSLALFSPSIPSSLPLCRIFLTFRRRLQGLTDGLTDWLTPSAQQRPRWKWKSVEPSTYLTDSVTCWLCVCQLLFFVLFCAFLRTLFREPDPHSKAEKWDPPRSKTCKTNHLLSPFTTLIVSVVVVFAQCG